MIQLGAANNWVGVNSIYGPENADQRNVIAGNTNVGVWIRSSGTTGNTVDGNYIGTDATGTYAIANYAGVEIDSGTTGNLVGTNGDGIDDALERNIISGNDFDGVWITGTGTSDNVVAGNYIGTDVTGTIAVGNGSTVVNVGDDDISGGVLIDGGASGNLIGTSGQNGAGDAAQRNVISGNDYTGIIISDTGTSGNVVAGNYLGTTASGQAALANGTYGDGVDIVNGASGNWIGVNAIYGPEDADEGNLISGNDATTNDIGVWIDPTSSGNVISGNVIGINAAGTASLPNAVGVLVQGPANLVGTNGDGFDDAIERNVISGNALQGVIVNGASATGNVIAGNLIGKNAAGTAALGNAADGVLISGAASGNWVGVNPVYGAENADEGNVISGNTSDGVEITGAGTTGNTVAGNYIGTDATGTIAIANYAGVEIDTGASGNLIGTNGDGVDDALERNIISGNTNQGVLIQTSASHNVVAGNYIGLNASGTGALGNAQEGVRLDSGATGNTIGGLTAGARNVIGGNGSRGVFINTPSGSSVLTTGNVIEGNFIGTAASGLVPMANSNVVSAISIDLSPGNTIGGTVAGAGNVIDGGGDAGIYVEDYTTLSPSAAAAGMLIAGNIIGLAADGETAAGFGNQYDGIVVDSAPNTTIGGSVAAARNIISNNTNHDGAGILIANFEILNQAYGTVVQGNYIGTDITGTVALGNYVGVDIEGASSNLVGTDGQDGAADLYEGNLISGNLTAGIRVNGAPASVGGFISHAGAADNVIAGNFIGTTADGGAALGNGADGVQLEGGTTGNWIGVNSVYGPANADEGNLISGNASNGVELTGTGTMGNVVAGNSAGLNAAGTGAIPNHGGAGVIIDAGASSNTIGGTAAVDRNVLSGNSGDGNSRGIYITNTGTEFNVVIGNYIGTNAAGTAAVANDNSGILISNGASNNTIGGAAAGDRNLVSGNTLGGIVFDGATVNGNLAEGNWVGLNAAGTGTIANLGGIAFIDSATGDEAIGNVVSGNTGSELSFIPYDTTTGVFDNLAQGNLIGTDPTGTFALGTAGPGVLIDGGSSGNTIGGTTAGAGNLISGNTDFGVEIEGSGTAGNVFEGNTIGLNLAGASALGNSIGVGITTGASNNTIGGTAAGSGNVISGNQDDGIAISGAGTTGNLVASNWIGTNPTGTVALGNGGDGVYLSDAPTNTIGGTAMGAGNLISGNDNGIEINDSTGILVQGNMIGIDQTGTIALGNSGAGVLVDSGSSGITIGGAVGSARNVISGNAEGVMVTGAATSGTLIAGNLIGTDVKGTSTVPNLARGSTWRPGRARPSAASRPWQST